MKTYVLFYTSYDDWKIIGVFSSKTEAENAKKLVKNLSYGGIFLISEHILDQVTK